ncbi:hypothetical protein POVCU2_0055840 [Plasmodium ovale curtisi]|nr:hypothetical protein POVCU2_0055840 [Plasmodium ovale curtisi]
MINGRKFKRVSKKSENLIAQAPIYNSRILFVNDNNIDTEISKELKKCNNSDVQYILWSHLFAVSLNICYKNAIPKFSLLMILFQVFILQFAVESNAETTSLTNGDSHTQGTKVEKSESPEEGSDGSAAADIVIKYLLQIKEYVELVVEFVILQFKCVLRDPSAKYCTYSRFIVPGIVGGVTLFFSLIILILYWRGMCCCKPPNAKKMGEDALRAQFEQMQQQMQMQQQQMYRNMMDGYTTDDGEDEDDEDDEDDDDEEDEEDEEVEEDYKKGKGDKEKEKKENKAKKKVKKGKKEGKGEKKKEEKGKKKKEEKGKKKEDEGKKKEEKKGEKKEEEKGEKKEQEREKKEEKGKKKEDEGKKKEEKKGEKKEQEGEKKEEKEEKKEEKVKKKEQDEEKKEEKEEKKDEDKGKQKAQGNTHNTRKNNSKNDNIHIGYHATT